MGMVAGDIVLPDETRRAIAELVNGDARRALNTLEMMADMAELDASGKRVLETGTVDGDCGRAQRALRQ